MALQFGCLRAGKEDRVPAGLSIRCGDSPALPAGCSNIPIPTHVYLAHEKETLTKPGFILGADGFFTPGQRTSVVL